MDNIKRFFECLIPVTSCNLKCSYCYIIQRNHRYMETPKLKYSVEQIGRALRKERMGGTCYFSLCGAGETLFADNIVELITEILKQGHYVNVTTNGTTTKQFERLSILPQEYLARLQIAFSFHYLELNRINRIEGFFANVNLMKESGASVLIQINLCDEYEPHLENIKKLCVENVGALPQVAATRKEISLDSQIEILTNHTEDEYKKIGEAFNSPLFDFTMNNFNIRRQEFCYAGDWSGVLNFETGLLRKCYSDTGGQYIFDDPNSTIIFSPIGRCESLFCMNASHFLSLGTIPEIYTDTTYGSLRYRDGWYSENMRCFLNHKLIESNKEYSAKEKRAILRRADFSLFIRKVKKQCKEIVKKILRIVGVYRGRNCDKN